MGKLTRKLETTYIFINRNQVNKLHFIQIMNYYAAIRKNKMGP